MEKKEVSIIIITIVLMSLILLLHEKSSNFLWIAIISAIIILVSVFCKKLTAKIIDIKIEHKFWQVERVWFGKGRHLKNPVPAGIITPALFPLLPYLKWVCFSFLQFESKALPGKAVKKYGTKRFSSVTEFDLSMISFYGILGVLIISILAKLTTTSFPSLQLILLSKYSLYYAIWNILPISQLDGAKLFFGSSRLFFFTLILLAISTFIFILP